MPPQRDIYKVKKLTPEELKRAYEGEPNTKDEEVVLADETASDEQNKTPDNVESVENTKRIFKYPLSIGKNYPARIIFRVFEVDGDNVFEKAGIGIEKIWDQLKGGLAEAVGLDDPGALGQETVANETVTTEEGIKILKDSETKQTQVQSYVNKGVGNEIGTVTLPLQRPLRYADVAEYEGASLGVIGGLANDVANGNNPFEGISSNGKLASTASSLAAQIVARNLGGLTGAVGGAALGGLAGAAAGGVGGIGGAVIGGVVGSNLGSNLGEDLGGAAKAATRISSAPNFRTLFSHAQIRNFSFDFKMIATSKEESVAINNIIKLFRQELYPEKIPFGSTGLPFAYKFPNVFEIEVKNKNDNTMGFKFQRCYLRNVQTVFNETATGVYDDGNFIEVSITLDFMEIVALDKQKVRDEDY